MFDFDNLVNRHGEFWVQHIIEGTEKARGICVSFGVSLEDRWNFLMNDQSKQQRMAA